ncbi:MAG: RnfABCDGE type electron transport complex subunit D [Clostridia bacterium]|nr:RnfABCDGE type electron transport complex subunit D [Clostridia bacterium]
MEKKLTVSYSPHVRGYESVASTMLEVIIALVPALAGGVYYFGFRALAVCAVTVMACVLSEYVWDKLTGKENTTGDLSAVVTGMLLSFTLPVTIPYYMAAVGGIFAIIVVKMFFGGIGQNFVNPALAARGFLLASWPVAMTSFVAPMTKLKIFSSNADAVTSATPLAYIKDIEGAEAASYTDLFFGNIPGCIGEVSALLILIGGMYLIFKKVIRPIIPFTYIITVGLFGYLFDGGFLAGDFLYHTLTGGVMLAGFFMATDYVTSPTTAKGEFIYALGAGVITGVIRLFGGYPEGVTYAILIMNIVTPIIDKYVRPRVFGTGRGVA